MAKQNISNDLPILSRTFYLLEKTSLPNHDLALLADVGFEWLRKFRSGAIKSPGVQRVQRLHDVLVTQEQAENLENLPIG